MIVLTVRWCLRFSLSYRDVEELLAERGVDVNHVTVYRWVQRFTPVGCVNAFMQLVGTHEGGHQGGRVGAPGLAGPR